MRPVLPHWRGAPLLPARRESLATPAGRRGDLKFVNAVILSPQSVHLVRESQHSSDSSWQLSGVDLPPSPRRLFLFKINYLRESSRKPALSLGKLPVAQRTRGARWPAPQSRSRVPLPRGFIEYLWIVSVRANAGEAPRVRSANAAARGNRTNAGIPAPSGVLCPTRVPRTRPIGLLH
jgi:hypothetical protein